MTQERNKETNKETNMNPTKKPWVAVLGCGYWGKNLIRNFAELGNLFAVSDLNKSSADELALAHKTRSLTWDEILNDKTIDAVIIATPAVSHAAFATQALEAGKHVFVEKPLALKVQDAEKLCDLARKKDRHLMVGHLLRYHPVFQKLKEIVDQGSLGRIQYIYSNRLNFGKIRREEDILWSFAPHDISMILNLIGSEPERIEAVGGYYLHKNIADVTTTHLHFPGGEQAHIFVSWLHPFKEQKLIVVGDRGMAVFDDGQAWDKKLVFYPHQVSWREGVPQPAKAAGEAIHVKEAEPLQEECKHFLNCIQHNQTPITNGEEGVKVLKILEQASAKLNQYLSGDYKTISHSYQSTTHTDQSPKHTHPDVMIHESAYIDNNVEIGKGSKVWHFSHILPGSKIGKNVIIGQNVMIGPDVVIGNNCKIQNNVSLYNGITLEDGVFCGPSCVFTNVNNPRAEINKKSEFRTTHVERGATIGANATIVCGHRIGAFSFIAAGAVVTKDVEPFALMAGIPAKRIGWMSEAGERLTDELQCPKTQEKYRLNSKNQLEKVLKESCAE